MADEENQTPEPVDRSNPRHRAPKWRTVWRFLGRMDLAAALILAFLVLIALGSCVPQLSPLVAADPERLLRWEALVRTRYGALADPLRASGAFRWFRSPIFLTVLASLATATLVCTLNRWQGLWRRVFRRPVRCSDVALERAPHTATLERLPAPRGEEDALPIQREARRPLPQLLRDHLERRGFRVRATAAADACYLRADRNRLTPLATLVTHLGLLLILLGAVLSSAYGWREQVTIAHGETVEIGHESRLAVRNEAFTVTRYPDGSVAGCQADVSVVAGGREVARGPVGVGEPLACGPVRLHLQSYETQDDGATVTLLAVHDPGYGLVISAGFMLLLGMTVSFNFPHCWVHARVEREGGVLRLAGRADRRAYDFGREFEALVEELSRVIGFRG